MAPASFSVSIIIPVYNEEETLTELYKRLIPVCNGVSKKYEVIFINDGSSDGSLRILRSFRKKNRNVKIINFSRNFGHQAAITAGIDYANGDAAIIMDADLQDPPELIPKFIEKWQEGYAVVYGQRIGRKGEGLFKKFTAKFFYKLLKAFTRYPIPENVGDFRLMDKKVILALRELREYHRFVRGLVSWIGFRQGAVAFIRDPRFAGKTKYPFKKMFSFAIDAITSFSILPLRIATFLGFGMVLVSLIFVGYTILVFFLGRTIPGWTSLALVGLFFGGIQLFIIGIIGEYIGRIYEEVKKRPHYIIESKEGFEET